MAVIPFLLIISGLAQQILAAPAANPDDGGIPPLLTFKDGNIGVNFLGFKASAGLGGLLTGDATQGGLHASAETPFGQKAGAGLGGQVGGNGRAFGGLYAGATAGGGVGASAGLDGSTGYDGSAGRSYATSSAGGVSRSVVKETVGGAPAGEASFVGSVNIQKVPPPPLTSRVDVKIEALPPPTEVHVKDIVVPKQEVVKKTYVERTVIPNYVEKTIQVPTVVEKTIRVPTVVEKTVKVPAPPTIIEKEIEVPQTAVKTKEVVIHKEVAPVPPTTVVKTKTKIHRRPWITRKRVVISDVPYYGGVAAGADSSVNSVDAGAYGGFGAFGNFGYAPTYYGEKQGTYTATVRKQYNGNLIRDIFNIPIATLGAVSNLVGNIAGGTSGSVSVSKSYGSY